MEIKTERTTLLSPEKIQIFDEILSRGLCSGKGSPSGQMCIEAAITMVLGEPFSDEPSCVTPEIRKFKILLNDKNWSSSNARAKGLRNIGIAQIGSKGVVDGSEFLSRLQTKIIGVMIPDLFRKIFKDNKKILLLVEICEREPIKENCLALASAAYAAYAAYAASAASAAYADYAASAAYADSAAYAAYAASAASAASDDYADYADYAASAASAASDDYADYAASAAYAASADYYYIMCANLALEVLKELKSPGCAWLEA